MAKEDIISRITINQNILHGKPSIRNLRYGVDDILSYLAGGDTVESLLKRFPDLENEDIQACLEYASKMIKSKSVYLTA
ncbi:MAG: DUF433 domain-containing protein [Spirochaetia bacterium]|nr:DUF433 domain-containing protein [Spirochaetia bacterium]